jgi:thioredoxin-like negative regulator of GroEL
MMNPVVERLARRRAGEIVVVKIDVERDQELARGLGVQGVPTFVIIHRGTERDRLSGAVPEEDFAFWVASRA